MNYNTLTIKQIVDTIKIEPEFLNLGSIQQERIIYPWGVWLYKLITTGFPISIDQSINILKTHPSMPENYRPILLNVAKKYISI